MKDEAYPWLSSETDSICYACFKIMDPLEKGLQI